MKREIEEEEEAHVYVLRLTLSMDFPSVIKKVKRSISLTHITNRLFVSNI